MSHKFDFQGKPYWVNPFNKRQTILLRLSILPWIAAVTLFVFWWFLPQHHISFIGSAVGTLILLFEVLMPAYFYNFVRRIKIVNPSIQPQPYWRVAMVVTRAPSEPWDVVQNTLIAMLNQDIPHDTWLADEQPTHQIVQWCNSNGVSISTRFGISEYHKKDWPRRTRCKEGNLAYFYDMYGYDKYDFVAQLDADHVPDPNYLREILRPFVDPSVGYVAAPSICDANADQSWSARGRLYAEATLHGPLQSGYNEKWAPLCIGSHYCVRTKALRQIGGLGPELAEDHSTSLMMNSHGWQGVFQPSAIAHGDGPASFPDCMIQEYQWSRSLVMILMKYTPKYIHGLSARKRFQFIFSQTWYVLFSSVAVIGYTIPLICLALDNPMLRITYLNFLCLSVFVSMMNLLPISLLKKYRFLRPENTRIFSWEYPLFTIARFPWIFGGIINGLFSSLTGKNLDFKVTPKGSEAMPPLPKRVLAPYLTISIVSSAIVLVLQDRRYAAGYYFLALVSALWMWICAMCVVILHYREGAAKRISALINSIALLFLSGALIVLSGIFRLPASASILLGGFNEGISSFLASTMRPRLKPAPEQDHALTSGCNPSPCFGYYDHEGTLYHENVPAQIHHDFIPWGEKYLNELTHFIKKSDSSNALTVVTLELWPWATLSLEPKATYREREDKANQSLLMDIAAGKYDAELIKSLTAISESASRPVIVRVMHEMESTKQYPWFNEDPDLFINAYRHIVRLSKKAGFHGLRWMWSPVGFRHASKYWPGGQYVDYVGLSIYATPEWNGGLAPEGRNISMDLLLKSRYWVRKYGKPIILAEVGINDSPAARVEWLKRAFIDIPFFPEVVGWVYFNQKQPPVITLPFGLPDWSLTQDEARSLKLIINNSMK